ncbi:MAG: 7-cyano-7-deazaguanine synthase [Burkholderiales bacterium]|nr:7-cyano-7-deazaguanine synthase [Burkholderiales bacterium]
MKITCALSDFDFAGVPSDLNIVLYGHNSDPTRGSAGTALKQAIVREKVVPAARAWDLLSIALAVVSADLAGHRDRSPDGWTREFELTVSVVDAPFWSANAGILQQMLAVLSTDRWTLQFVEGGILPQPDKQAVHPTEDCVVLLSGGLDSYIGAIDLVEKGLKPFAVSQMVRGDGEKQIAFAGEIGGGLRHFQGNHNTDVPDPENPPSQRARSIVFLAYGVLMATTLSRYHAGDEVTLYLCENGFIAINPPLTGGRIGSLSTRTTHPVFLVLLQQVLTAAGLRVKVENPYQLKTKGEMMVECLNQMLLDAHAHQTTSCGRFLKFGYKHCGRCVPCQVRRAAFKASGKVDQTFYVYEDLGIDDEEHAGFDDVRSALIGIAERRETGTRRWIGSSLSSALVDNKDQLAQTIERGLAEIESLMTAMRVQ